MKAIAGFLFFGLLAISAPAQQDLLAWSPPASIPAANAVPHVRDAPAADRPSGAKLLWRMSLLAVAAAQTSDVATSWGKWESNPLLANGRSQFGWKSLAIKPVTSSWLAVEWLPWMKRHRKLAAVVNFSAAGLVGWQAWRNAQIARPPH